MVTLKFHCSTKDGTTIECYAKIDSDVIYISIDGNYSDILGNLVLDKSTAIKFSKELRKQIDLIK